MLFEHTTIEILLKSSHEAPNEALGKLTIYLFNKLWSVGTASSSFEAITASLNAVFSQTAQLGKFLVYD
jgi:hypothetical protein